MQRQAALAPSCFDADQWADAPDTEAPSSPVPATSPPAVLFGASCVADPLNSCLTSLQGRSLHARPLPAALGWAVVSLLCAVLAAVWFLPVLPRVALIVAILAPGIHVLFLIYECSRHWTICAQRCDRLNGPPAGSDTRPEPGQSCWAAFDATVHRATRAIVDAELVSRGYRLYGRVLRGGYFCLGLCQ